MNRVNKRKVIDTSLKVITYIASFIAVIILGAILFFVFSRGSKLLSFKILVTDYHSKPYRLETTVSAKGLSFENPHIKDAYFSENFGFAVKDDYTLEGIKTIRFVYIDDNSPLKTTINEQGEKSPFKEGFIFDSTMRAVLEDESTVTIFSRYGAENLVNVLSDAVGIQTANVKSEGGGIRGSIITTLYLILLDIMLPDTSGIELLKYVRKDDKEIPIIIISALFNEMDKVIALDSGADDYITKPFGLLELTSRIQAKLRKVSDKSTINFHDIKIDLKQYKVYVKQAEVSLTNKEYEIFKYMIENAENVLTKEDIFCAVWNSDFMGETRALDMHIKALRQKLKEANSEVKIETVYGIGYKIGII